jgi:predicted RNA-binding Zn-ribbon protein involved in translation (DUF1610 family)
MTVVICRACGERSVLRSRFDAECPECGSEDLEPEDAYDPVEHELRCEFCGYDVDVTTGPDPDWSEGDDDAPQSVDDPCPVCGQALVPRSEARSIRDQPEYGVARGAARALHRDHAMAGPPYDVAALADELGLTVEVGSFLHDGMLSGSAIEVPDSATPTVQRFVIAHEIGHHVLRHSGDRAKAEPEANALASELLIPRELLLREIGRIPSVRALCAAFGVSREAMVYALMAARAIGRVRG